MIIPFLKIINKLGGLIFGFIEGVLFLGIGVFFILRFEMADTIIKTLGDSILIPIFESIGNLTSFLLPTVIRELNTIL
jgi:uncharacterized membrane protein required for colicin V production